MALPAELLQAFPGPFAPWPALLVLLILVATAAWDARTGIVPDLPLLAGAILWLAALGVAGEYTELWHAALWGAGTYGTIWLLNEGWYRFLGKDALGMGDAKWTALAIIPFGWLPALFAWFAGAWLAIVWIVGCYALKQRIRKVYFAPFLCGGLLIGIAVARGLIELPYPFTLPSGS